jgi:hypothetical protein
MTYRLRVLLMAAGLCAGCHCWTKPSKTETVTILTNTVTITVTNTVYITVTNSSPLRLAADWLIYRGVAFPSVLQVRNVSGRALSQVEIGLTAGYEDGKTERRECRWAEWPLGTAYEVEFKNVPLTVKLEGTAKEGALKETFIPPGQRKPGN